MEYKRSRGERSSPPESSCRTVFERIAGRQKSSAKGCGARAGLEEAFLEEDCTNETSEPVCLSPRGKSREKERLGTATPFTEWECINEEGETERGMHRGVDERRLRRPAEALKKSRRRV